MASRGKKEQGAVAPTSDTLEDDTEAPVDLQDETVDVDHVWYEEARHPNTIWRCVSCGHEHMPEQFTSCDNCGHGE